METFRVEAPTEELEDLRQSLYAELGDGVDIDEMLDTAAGELHEPMLVGMAIVFAPVVVREVRTIILGWLEHRRKMAYLRMVDELGRKANTPGEAIEMMRVLSSAS